MSDLLSRKTTLNDYTDRSGVYPKEQMNRIGRMLNNIKGQDGVRVDSTPYGITIHGTGELDHFRFQLVGSADGSNDPVVRIYLGKWTRNGNENELATDPNPEPGENIYLTIPYADLTTNSDNFLYLELDNKETPTEVTAEVDTTIPVQTIANVTWILGNAALDANDNLTITQYWWGGDIDDTTGGRVVDSDVDCSLTESLETTECTTSSSDADDSDFDRISGFKNPITVAGGSFGVAENEYVVLCRKAGDGTDTASVMRYWIPVDVEVVTDVTFSTVTHKLEKTKSTVTVFKQVVDPANPILVEQAEGCVAP